MIKLSERSKLGGILSFNMSPKLSCEHKTKWCGLYCYGLRGGRMSTQKAKEMYRENYMASHRQDFPEKMIEALSKIPQHRRQSFRIHSVGDFYSVVYYLKWVQIAGNSTFTSYLAYTRNLEVAILANLYRSTVPNMTVRYSMDPATVTGPKYIHHLPTSLVIPHRFKKLEHWTPIMVNGLEYNVCTFGNCINCLRCWVSKGRVAFPQKYAAIDKSIDYSNMEIHIKP